MVRVSDEEVQMVTNDMDGGWDLSEQMALDLRDARDLLREALGYVDEYTRLANDFGAEDVLRRGSQHLEGHDG